MSLVHWDHVDIQVQNQVSEIVKGMQFLLGHRLIGVYLHGSLAMGCFNPKRSDIDLLAVVDEQLEHDLHKQLIDFLLFQSKRPCPVEISVLTQADLNPWVHPCPFELHYSEGWRVRSEHGESCISALDQARRTDIDLAAHITILHKFGIVLTGQAIPSVFPEVPRQDYISAIMADATEIEQHAAENPVYTILNLCRVWMYLSVGEIVSKEEGGVWGARNVDDIYRPLVQQAVTMYRSQEEGSTGGLAPSVKFYAERVRDYTRYMMNNIADAQ